MSKDKYLLTVFAMLATLLLWYFFPISFDNNDDQIMSAISSGMFTNKPSNKTIFVNILIGNVLCFFNNTFAKFSFYTFLLQITTLASFITICNVFFRELKNNKLINLIIISLFFLGFFSLCFIKIQFTTVGLLGVGAVLLFLDNPTLNLKSFLFALFLISLSILIRKDCFYIFILFSVLVLMRNYRRKNYFTFFISFIICTSTIFFIAQLYNNKNKNYEEIKTYTNFNTIDIIGAKPIETNISLLTKNNFSLDDIALIQLWFIADEAYLAGDETQKMAVALKKNRNILEVKQELEKFIIDEKYVLIMYAISILIVICFARKLAFVSIINLLVFIALLLFLTITNRIPHRVTFPIITYLFILNLLFFIQNKQTQSMKFIVFSCLFILSCYKFYCTSKLYEIHKQNHIIFSKCANEINTHPNNLFIALDGFPFQYLNAWQPLSNMFPAHNIIPTGWYACTPDYQLLLKLHQLNNLTIDLKNRQNILFLTSNKALQQSYINVMKQRYNIVCHFEDVKENFLQMHPKKLVIDNN